MEELALTLSALAVVISVCGAIALRLQDQHSARLRAVERVLNRIEALEDGVDPHTAVHRVTRAYHALRHASEMDEASTRLSVAMTFAIMWQDSIRHDEVGPTEPNWNRHWFIRALRNAETALECDLYAASFSRWWSPTKPSSSYPAWIVPNDPSSYTNEDNLVDLGKLGQWEQEQLARRREMS